MQGVGREVNTGGEFREGRAGSRETGTDNLLSRMRQSGQKLLDVGTGSV